MRHWLVPVGPTHRLVNRSEESGLRERFPVVVLARLDKVVGDVQA